MRFVLGAAGHLVEQYPVTSRFQAVDTAHTVPHQGVDLAIPAGTDILAPAKGVVSRVMDLGDQSLGKAVYLKLQSGNEVILGHLSKINVRAGQVVEAGQKLAESGSTGYSTGPHLHIGLKSAAGQLIDPQPIVQVLQRPGFWERATDGAIIPNLLGKSKEAAMSAANELTLDIVRTALSWLATTGLALAVEGLLLWSMVCLLIGVSGSGKWVTKGTKAFLFSTLLGVAGRAV
ncbi:hypothetical protein J31TS4_18960 [Paenibacillus sp. J31TS4]|uniref:M23 family metallopeptidase n=1 Tax=Paenibacillus sp. J31TS4 TaxID=2807195 RepID=UPI001B0A4396|nr:M23 family metallopeptidase [Paenibacillus sp. J31TS4]GIP38616.1 hypothetical protein J31TS4_18960 [Paenibacillus sp. J31TS4]